MTQTTRDRAERAPGRRRPVAVDHVTPSGPASRTTIVVPTRDTRELTHRCVAAIRRASGDARIVVVDDGSVDDTAESLRRRGEGLEILENRRSRGFSAAANQGLARAHGDPILLLNSDTEIGSDAIRILEEALAADSSLGIVGPELEYADKHAQWSGGAAPTLPWLLALASGLAVLVSRVPGYRLLRPLRSRRRREVDWVTGAAMAFRREVWEEVGPFDERFRLYAQDLDFCLRARAAGWRVEIVPEFRVVHHHGATVGRRPGAAGRQNPELLWTDLLLWARKHRGDSWARKAARALRWGGRLRVFGRTLCTPWLLSRSRGGWRRDTLAYRRALQGLDAFASEL